MTYNTYTLGNGLRILHIPDNYSKVAYCGFAVDAGTRDELPGEEGMAHYVEHTIFKGTEHRRAWHIINRMENVGGNLDAFTSKEETIIYSVFLREHFARAAELLVDIVFHSTFPQAELDKEVEVIIDEIQSYEDSPSELIFDEFEKMVFEGHELGRDILGSPDVLRGFKSQDALDFVHRNYTPDNMVFFIRGDISFKRIVKRMEALTGDIPCGKGRRERHPVPLYVPGSRVVDRGSRQSYVMLGCRSFESESRKQTVLFLLNNLLGGPGMNSRLNVALREKRGLVYTVETNMTTYTDTGVFSIFFGCDDEDVDKCMSLTRTELSRLSDAKLTPAALAAIKKQTIGQLGVAGDNFEANTLDAGKIFLHYNKYDDEEKIFERIMNVTADDIRDVAAEKFSEENMSMLIYK